MIMKKIFILVVTITLLSLSAVTANDFKVFKDKSGKLTYEVTGARQGTVIITFDDYGRKMTIENNFSFNGTPNNSISYVEGDTSYVYDNLKKTGYKLPYIERTTYINKYLGIGDPELTYTELYKSMGGKVIDRERVNGKKCDVWEIKNRYAKIWLWKTYRIKEEYTGLKAFQSTETMKTMQLNIEIPKEQFIKPDVKYNMFTGEFKN